MPETKETSAVASAIREKVLASRGKVEKVPNSEEIFGITVYVRELGQTEAARFSRSVVESLDWEKLDEKGNPTARVNLDALMDRDARFAALVACDDSGDRVFSDEDAEALGRINPEGLEAIVDAGRELNPQSEEEIEAEGKGSDATDDAGGSGAQP